MYPDIYILYFIKPFIKWASGSFTLQFKICCLELACPAQKLMRINNFSLCLLQIDTGNYQGLSIITSLFV